MMTESGIAVIVVRWKGGDEVRRCLQAVVDDTADLDAEVVLVDSGSGDGGAEELGHLFPTVRVLGLQENRSFAWACTQGVEATEAPLIYLLNPDTEVAPGSTACLIEFLDQNPSAAGAVPALIGPDGDPQLVWQLRRLPSRSDLALGRPGAPALVESLPDQPLPVEQPAAAAWLLRRTIWQGLGGLDPSFAPAWWEDVDFCQRLARRHTSSDGFWLIPDARVRHHGGSSLERLGDEAFQIAFNANLVRFARRHHRDSLRLIVFVLRLSLRLRCLAKPKRSRAYRAALNSSRVRYDGSAAD